MTHEEEKNRTMLLERMKLNFKKARLAYDDPRYPNTVPGLMKLMVPDKEGIEQIYVCFEHDLPEDAKHLLKKEK